MLTGRHPVRQRRLPTTIAETLAADPDAPDIPRELWSVINRTLEKKPDDRFRDNQGTRRGAARDIPGTPGTSARTSGTQAP